MPLIRKPTDRPALKKTGADDLLKGLADPDPDQRWAAAREAARVPGGAAALAMALPAENDPRVREAMFTALARIGTPETAAAVISLLRSDAANLRTGALDTLRLMVSRMHDLLPKLLKDQDVDVRILSCELGRSLPSPEATSLMCARARQRYRCQCLRRCRGRARGSGRDGSTAQPSRLCAEVSCYALSRICDQGRG